MAIRTIHFNADTVVRLVRWSRPVRILGIAIDSQVTFDKNDVYVVSSKRSVHHIRFLIDKYIATI